MCDAVHFVFEGCVEEGLDRFEGGRGGVFAEPAGVTEGEEETEGVCGL